MTTRELVERFIGGATAGTASSLRIEGDTLYSYAYPLARRGADGVVTVNAAPMGQAITEANPAFDRKLSDNAHTRPRAAAYIESRRERYYDVRDAAFSVTTNRARRMIEAALQGR